MEGLAGLQLLFEPASGGVVQAQAQACAGGPVTRQCTTQPCNTGRQGALPGACISAGAAAGMNKAPQEQLALHVSICRGA